MMTYLKIKMMWQLEEKHFSMRRKEVVKGLFHFIVCDVDFLQMEVVWASVTTFKFSRILYYVFFLYNVEYSSNGGKEKKALMSWKDLALYQALSSFFSSREKGGEFYEIQHFSLLAKCGNKLSFVTCESTEALVATFFRG